MYPSQLVDQRRIFRGLCAPPFDDNIPTLGPAEITQPVDKAIPEHGVAGVDEHARHLSRLLRLSGERCGEERRTRANEERAPVHHIPHIIGWCMPQPHSY